MKKQRTLISILFLTIFSIQIYGQSDHSKNTDNAKLEFILKKCAGYCERVKSIALFYVCQEEIKDKTNFYRIANTLSTSPYGDTEVVPGRSLKLNRTRTSSYLYDYQLINKEEELQEQRTLLKKNNRKKNIENAKLETRFNAKYLVYGPVGFLSRYWQNYFSYEIMEQESLGEIQATIIKATPKPNNIENRNIAKLWINEKDNSILQIEWESGSIYNFDGKNIATMSGEFGTIMTWRVTYGLEKNGVRFPSRHLVQEFLVAESGERYLRNEIITNFNDYKFFIVESEIKY
ncbi:MAG: hypothetical protein MUP98_04965 [Candidatus Aminicenantes bacterium]|nr:hypothetical protein [Candidatus Aminicenantes bacterium]